MEAITIMNLNWDLTQINIHIIIVTINIISLFFGSTENSDKITLDGNRMLANQATVASLFRPCEKKKTLIYDLSLIVGGSLFIGVCTQIAIGWPVPFTGQTFAVLMAGFLLGRRRASLCVIAYLIEASAGMPFFAHGKSGLVTLLGPTGGYLFGFIAAAYVTGLLAERQWDKRFWSAVAAMILGNLVMYGFGMAELFCRYRPSTCSRSLSLHRR